MQPGGVGQGEGPGCAGGGWLRQRDVLRGGHQGHEQPAVPADLLPAEEGEAPAGRECGTHVREGGDRIGEEHHPETREREVEGARREGEGLRVGVLEAHVVHAELAGARAGPFEHRGGDVDPQHGAAGGDPFSELQTRLPAAAADVEHALAGRHLCPLDGRESERSDLLIEQGFQGHPLGSRLLVPVLDLLCVGSGRGEGHDDSLLV